jgi:threonine synthase
LAEQLGWSLPDALLYPTASGMGIAGLWKAFEELEAMGFVGPKRPRIYAVQAEGCAPIARAFETGDERAAAWPEIRTRYARFRVAETVVDSLVLRALRASHGAAVAVSDAEILQGVKRAAADEGMLLSPGGGACVAALQRLKASGHLSPHDSILLVDTAAAFRHTDLLAALR